MQCELHCQPHCGWEPDCVPPARPYIHPGGGWGWVGVWVTVCPQPLHHLQGVPACGLWPRFKEPGQEEPPASHSHSPFFPPELALCRTKGCKGSEKGDYVAAKRRITKVG